MARGENRFWAAKTSGSVTSAALRVCGGSPPGSGLAKHRLRFACSSQISWFSSWFQNGSMNQRAKDGAGAATHCKTLSSFGRRRSAKRVLLSTAASGSRFCAVLSASCLFTARGLTSPVKRVGLPRRAVPPRAGRSILRKRSVQQCTTASFCGASAWPAAAPVYADLASAGFWISLGSASRFGEKQAGGSAFIRCSITAANAGTL